MRKRLQVFVSSTFKDLQEERQAAVEAILRAGHIPAGMELFSAGNDSQWTTICRWIDASDVYLLILGGRYGTLHPTLKLSYTQLEFDYAVEHGKPVFSVVMSPARLDEKVKSRGKDVLELDNPALYQAFREPVLARMCTFFDDVKDIKLSIASTIKDFEGMYSFSGWVSGADVASSEALEKDIARLAAENARLIQTNAKLERDMLLAKSKIVFDYAAIKGALSGIVISVPASIVGEPNDFKTSALRCFSVYKDDLVVGVENAYEMSETAKFLFFTLAPRLATFGLVETVKITGSRIQRFCTTASGREFLGRLEIERQAAKVANSPAPEADSVAEGISQTSGGAVASGSAEKGLQRPRPVPRPK